MTDLHLCCLLPQYGFNMVMAHPHAVNEIALSLNNRNPRSVLRPDTTTTTAPTNYKLQLESLNNYRKKNYKVRLNNKTISERLQTINYK